MVEALNACHTGLAMVRRLVMTGADHFSFYPSGSCLADTRRRDTLRTTELEVILGFSVDLEL